MIPGTQTQDEIIITRIASHVFGLELNSSLSSGWGNHPDVLDLEAIKGCKNLRKNDDLSSPFEDFDLLGKIAGDCHSDRKVVIYNKHITYLKLLYRII